MAETEREREVSFVLKEHFGVLSSNGKGWTRELNLVSWNGKPEKYDIRDWCEEHTRMRRGITLSQEEAAALGRLLNDLHLQ